MATFKPPRGYGTKDQHVCSPAQNFGYFFLVAYLVDGGNSADYIKRACADALAEGAPKDVVCHTDGRWKRRSEMNLMFGRRLSTYADALARYAEELEAEREKEK